MVQNPLPDGRDWRSGRWSITWRRSRSSAKISTGETLVTPENMDEPEVDGAAQPAEGGEPDRRRSVSGAKAKKWRVMVIPKGTTHEFWKTIHAGALKAAEELGNVEVIWQGPQKEDDRSQQIQLVQNAVAAGVDGIVLAPLDAKALVKPVEEAIAKGIPVVIIDSGLESSKIVSYVATDNYHGGVLAARRLGELLKGEGKIILLRYAVGSASTEEREKGFTDTIAKEFPKITYLSDDRVRRGDLGLGPAEVAEPGDAVSGARSTGSSARTSRARSGCSGPWRGPGCWRAGRERRRLLTMRGVAKSFGASRALDGVVARPGGGRGPRPDRRERGGQEHADEDPQRGLSARRGDR